MLPPRTNELGLFTGSSQLLTLALQATRSVSAVRRQQTGQPPAANDHQAMTHVAEAVGAAASAALFFETDGKAGTPPLCDPVSPNSPNIHAAVTAPLDTGSGWVDSATLRSWSDRLTAAADRQKTISNSDADDMIRYLQGLSAAVLTATGSRG